MYLLILILILPLMGNVPAEDPCIAPEWGFFGHRRINRLAVFTLPEEMLPLYKTQIEYLTEHAVDPDKRRYATTFEGVRHYMDLDQWGEQPFDNVPRRFEQALARFSNIILVYESGDTSLLHWNDYWPAGADTLANANNYFLESEYYRYVRDSVWIQYYDGPNWKAEGLKALLQSDIHAISQIWIRDVFTEHGIVPYNLYDQYYRLVKAFEAQDWERVIRYSSDIGHYVGDAHTPLHTTKNYNGQLTNQIGIHAFWESRIPELFADESFNYFGGKATYIENKRSYFWDIVLESHSLVDSVLLIEKRVSEQFPEDRQYCFGDRNGINVRQQCPEYAKAYDEAMDGMVESRFKSAIQSTGSVWYSAWVDAGSPDLYQLYVTAKVNADTSLFYVDPKVKESSREHWD
jgi:hypothetical protein